MKVYHFLGKAPLYTNCFLLIGENGNAIAIDPSAKLEQYTQMLEKHNAVLQYIVLTHGHYDHVDTLHALKKQTGAKVLMAQGDAMQFKLHADDFLQDGATVEADDIKLQVIATPGHTPGCVCLWSKEESLLFTGDTLFNGDVGRTDLPGGNYDTLMASLKKLCNTVTGNPQVLPGHESFSDMDTQRSQNPYLRF
ncbi:MAG: MBL fold metallo-hydrolase [Oscillospiraceae bacterium]|nr:MBL fold metallo-hydrolase [Oscillospiraceae bacterium]